MKSSSSSDLLKFMLIPTKFRLSPNSGSYLLPQKHGDAGEATIGCTGIGINATSKGYDETPIIRI